MHESIASKLEMAREIIRQTGGCAVAYSGGVDSSLVLAIAGEVLENRYIAVIATSSTYSKRECDEAMQRLRRENIPFRSIVSEELDIPGFRDNPPDRCYYCKKELFGEIRKIADEYGFPAVLDGTNADDAHDYRPGLNAACELEVISPLKEAGITKGEIRTISRDIYALPTADKPAMACLASRFPYGSSITREKLEQVDTIEAFLTENGYTNFRARHHGDILRLEIDRRQIAFFLDSETYEECIDLAKRLGFTYVTLDMEGYRSGSMNEILPRK